MSHPTLPVSTELQLLIACADNQEWSPAVAPGLDWERFLALASRHGLLPLAYSKLERHTAAQVAPKALLDKMQRAYYLNSAHCLSLRQQLGLLLRALHDAGVDAVPLKGIDQSLRLYHADNLRAAGDIDILIRHSERKAAAKVLRLLGYVSPPATTAQQRVHQSYSHHDAYVNRSNSVLLELHWSFAPSNLAVDAQIDAVWSRTQDGDFDGAPCRRLAPIDMALFLCVHGSKHHWSRLCWLADMLRLTDQPDLDWDSALAHCTGLGMGRMMRLQLLLLSRLFNAPLSDAVRASVVVDRRAAALADRVVTGLDDVLYDPAENSLRLAVFDAALRDRPSDSLRVAVGSLIAAVRVYGAKFFSPASEQPSAVDSAQETG